jgi:hypothetical protein
MRKDRVAQGASPAPKVEDIDVDLPGSVAEAPRAAHGFLDPLRGAQEAFGRSLPEDRRHGVPEVGLRPEAHRVGSVEGRHRDDRRDAGEFPERSFQMGAAVAAIGA